jgi:expansin (peptidoglycan-binding protein)
VDYDTAAACGAFVHIVGPGGQVTVRIVDRCPECPAGNIDLSKEAFAIIAAIEQGRVPITWTYVPGDVAGPISYRFKAGSNQWWTAVQVLNHRYPIRSLEIQDAKGAWITLVRQEYNYFVYASGMGPGPYTLRVTDINGQALIDTNIPLTPGGIVIGSANFGPVANVERLSTASKSSMKYKTKGIACLLIDNNVSRLMQIRSHDEQRLVVDMRGRLMKGIKSNKDGTVLFQKTIRDNIYFVKPE